jgi:flagellar basal body-associated protein FliL
MKFMVVAIGLIAVLLVAGGGAAYYLFNMQKKEPVAAAAAPPEQAPVFGDPLRLEQIGLPLVSEKRYAGYVLFQSAYVVPRDKLEAAKLKLPHLQDAIIRDLNKRPLRPENSDEAEIKRRLMAVAEQVFGPKYVYEVQLQRLAKTN